MPKETYAGGASQPPAPATTYSTEDELLAQATRFFEQLNDRARTVPRTPPLGGKAQEALDSFRQTAARLEVLKPEFGSNFSSQNKG